LGYVQHEAVHSPFSKNLHAPVPARQNPQIFRLQIRLSQTKSSLIKPKVFPGIPVFQKIPAPMATKSRTRQPQNTGTEGSPPESDDPSPAAPSAPAPASPAAGARDQILNLKQRISAAVIGQETVVEQLLIALLADGHLLMEGLPGLAKTRTIKTLAKNLESQFSRIQFTPDLLPSDITGTEIYTGEGAGGKFEFQQGPVFGNLILADEINRAPAKAQAALLEAMEERQVTVAGKTHPLPELFLVLATQNPIEQEGTYPLPEAQMDRFLLHVFVGYANDDDERKILRLVRGEDANRAPVDNGKVPAQAALDARREVLAVQVSDAVEKYMVALIAATRRPGDFKQSKLSQWIKVGASPRGTLALDRASRASAWLQGKDAVTPAHVQSVAHACLRHRLILTYEAEAEGITKDSVLDELLKLVAVP
jgi:MoxR-like ATPase